MTRIDCRTCPGRPVECTDCVVNRFLQWAGEAAGDVAPEHVAAVGLLARNGMVGPQGILRAG